MGSNESDEVYVLDLCDELLGEQGLRQHRFDWLLGDPGTSGQRVTLPVDAYWPGQRLIVEYREIQHDRSLPHFDKPDRLTVSGVHRGQQQALYDARCDTLIPQQGIRLVVVRPADHDADSRGSLRRSRDADLQAVNKILAPASDEDRVTDAFRRFLVHDG
ncbi:hypothetical protein ACFYTG_46635 [Streptomyces mirabilis]|uniref:hypothetical protein n=1 Tax=Streptomyces mirabilis TaxID=68239 RepID=UPI00367F1C58